MNGALCPRFHKAIELIGGRWTGAVLRHVLPDPPIKVEYELTEMGKELNRSLEAIGNWARA